MVMPNPHHPRPEWVSSPHHSKVFCEIIIDWRNSERFKIQIDSDLFLFSHSLAVFIPYPRRHTYWMLFAMYSEHFRCDIVHSFDMGRWNCWRHLRFRYRSDMLLCGEYDSAVKVFHAVCVNKNNLPSLITFVHRNRIKSYIENWAWVDGGRCVGL